MSYDEMPISYRTGAFPPTALDWNTLIPLLGPTSAAIARYDGVLAAIPNSAVLLSPLTSQEAVLSSSIEGTHATMSEVLSLEAGADELLPQDRRGDIFEVLNYRAAMREAPRFSCVNFRCHNASFVPRIACSWRGFGVPTRRPANTDASLCGSAPIGMTPVQPATFRSARLSCRRLWAHGSSICMPMRLTAWSNWRSYTPSSNPCTRSSTAMAGLDFSVLVEGRGRRSSVYALKSLLNVAEGKEVFN